MIRTSVAKAAKTQANPRARGRSSGGAEQGNPCDQDRTARHEGQCQDPRGRPDNPRRGPEDQAEELDARPQCLGDSRGRRVMLRPVIAGEVQAGEQQGGECRRQDQESRPSPVRPPRASVRRSRGQEPERQRGDRRQPVGAAEWQRGQHNPGRHGGRRPGPTGAGDDQKQKAPDQDRPEHELDLPAPEEVGIMTGTEQQQREDGIGRSGRCHGGGRRPRASRRPARPGPGAPEHPRPEVVAAQTVEAQQDQPRQRDAVFVVLRPKPPERRGLRPGDHRDDVEVVADRHVRPEPGDQAQVEQEQRCPNAPDENPGPRLHAVDGGRDHPARRRGSCGHADQTNGPGVDITTAPMGSAIWRGQGPGRGIQCGRRPITTPRAARWPLSPSQRRKR